MTNEWAETMADIAASNDDTQSVSSSEDEEDVQHEDRNDREDVTKKEGEEETEVNKTDGDGEESDVTVEENADDDDSGTDDVYVVEETAGKTKNDSVQQEEVRGAIDGNMRESPSSTKTTPRRGTGASAKSAISPQTAAMSLLQVKTMQQTPDDEKKATETPPPARPYAAALVSKALQRGNT